MDFVGYDGCNDRTRNWSRASGWRGIDDDYGYAWFGEWNGDAGCNGRDDSIDHGGAIEHVDSAADDGVVYCDRHFQRHEHAKPYAAGDVDEQQAGGGDHQQFSGQLW